MTAATVESLGIPTIAARADCSESTVRKAMGKWREGVDDGQFPPPLRCKRKGDGKRAALVALSTDFEEWLERWPDA